MAKVHNHKEILLKASIPCVGHTNITDDRNTDDRG